MSLNHHTIHRACVDDVPDIACMVGELLEEIMATVGSAVFRFSLAETTARLADFIEHDKYFVFVARDTDGVASGFIALYESHALYAEGAFGTIPELFVRSPWRSSLLVRQLIGASKRSAAGRGLPAHLKFKGPSPFAS